MQKLIYILILSFTANAFSMEKVKRDEIASIIPKELSSLSGEKLNALNKKFKSKIADKNDSSLFLNYFSTNDVTIGLKDKKFKYVLIQANDEMVTKSSGLFARAYSGLTDEQKSKVAEELKSSSHEAGRTISIDMPEEGMKLEFNNNEKKTLQSIILWPVGGEHP